MIMAIERENEIVAFFPLMRQKGVIRFIGYPQNNYADIIADPAYKEECIAYLLHYGKKQRGVVFDLHGLLESGQTDTCIKKQLHERKHPVYSSNVVSPMVRREQITLPTYMKKKRKKHGVDRKEKRLRKLGNLTYQVLDQRNLSRVFELHRKRWRKKIDGSGFTTSPSVDFFTEQIQHHPSANIVHALCVEGEMIAYVYELRRGGRRLLYNLAHDDDFRVFSPGRILMNYVIEQWSQSEDQLFDFTIGYESYKYDWNTEEDYVHRVVFPGKGLRAQVLYMWMKGRQKFVHTLKKSESIVKFRRNTMGKWKNAIQRWRGSSLKSRIQWVRRQLFQQSSRSLHHDYSSNNRSYRPTFQPIDLKDVFTLKETHQDTSGWVERLYKREYGFHKGGNWFWVTENAFQHEEAPHVVMTNCGHLDESIVNEIRARFPDCSRYIYTSTKEAWLYELGFVPIREDKVTKICSVSVSKQTINNPLGG